MKKTYIALAIFTIITLMTSMVFAATTSKFEVVDDQVCTIKLNDYCTFEKRMTSYDLDKRQVTIQLKITNDAPANQPTGEVMLLLDNSGSMEEETSTGAKRGKLVFDSAKTLIQKMLKDNDNLKVGIARFSTNTDISKEGTLEDASIVSELSSDVNTLTSAIDNIQNDGPRTDLDSGLNLVKEHFSTADTNKYIIVLTDGVPNVALEAANDYYGSEVINKTKATLQSLQSNNYKVITMLTGINNAEQKAGTHDYTFQYVIENIFGTQTNPTAGNFYYISDEQIEQTIKEDIYKDLLPEPQSVKDIKINDFFPKEIVDNFDFAYVSQPTKGTISQSIDNENKIVWSLDELSSGESATVQYTLTLKDNYDPSIVNVILDTNENVTINYKDFDGTDKSKTSEDTPKVRITELKGDTTTAKTIIPKAGAPVIIAGASLLVIIAIASGAKILKINNDMKKQ
ncbi:MAG: VWA domain-containing protein [Clostridia bacterium]|nr:VWA domain-containing protein [Clostridia bacterium]